MNPLYQSLVRIQQRLTAAGIASAVIGGIAVSAWARPRATQDIDFKVLLDRDAAQRLLDVLAPDYVPCRRILCKPYSGIACYSSKIARAFASTYN